jgi:hypothetical protein
MVARGAVSSLPRDPEALCCRLLCSENPLRKRSLPYEHPYCFCFLCVSYSCNHTLLRRVQVEFHAAGKPGKLIAGEFAACNRTAEFQRTDSDATGYSRSIGSACEPAGSRAGPASSARRHHAPRGYAHSRSPRSGPGVEDLSGGRLLFGNRGRRRSRQWQSRHSQRSQS